MTTVTMSPRASPSYRVGPRSGFKNDALIETPDLHVTDDALVEGDMEVVGTLYCGTLSSGADVSTNHIVAALTVDSASHLTAAAGATNIDYALSTGTFTSPSGTNVLAGNTSISGTKTFATGTGAVALNGHVTLASAKNLIMSGASTVTTGTGAIALNGDVTVAADKAILMQGTGAFTTGSGAVTLAGATGVSDHLTIAANKNLVMGTAGSGTGTIQSGIGNISLNGDITVATGKDILMIEAGTGTFFTGAGDVHLNGDVTVATGKNLTMVEAGAGTFKTGTGAITLNGTATVVTGKSMVVTDADKLTVGGIIVPQTKTITVPLNALSADQWVFVADAAYELVSAETVYTVTSTGACTLNIMKSTSVQAPSAAATMLVGTLDMGTTANTVYGATVHGTEGNRRLADGNKMGIVLSDNAPDGLAGCVLTITLKRV